MATFQRPLKVGKIDNYTLTMSSNYLASEVIISATVTTTSSALTILSVTNDGNVISALCSGEAEGSALMYFDWTTATRSGCEAHVIVILPC
jgi:exosome complex RNA-binding protein Csl4